MKIMLIDNHDSFTHNIAHLVHSVSRVEPIVIPYTQLSEKIVDGFDHIFISPGPDCPAAYPAYNFIRNLNIPVTGICLGMQILNELYGGTTSRAPQAIHGKTDTISWRGKSMNIARYHSLRCDIVADCFVTESVSSDGCPMIISHRAKPFTGFQFHPESFMTENGKEFIEYVLGK